jgi:hypothetical protein
VLAGALVLAASLAALGLGAIGGAPGAPTGAPSASADGTARPASLTTPSATPAPSLAPTPTAAAVHVVGEDVPVGDLELHRVERAERWQQPADRGSVFVTVEVRVRATAPDVPFDSAYYQLRDATGALARPIPNGRAPLLAYGRLARTGDEATGWVTFETSDARPYRLTYLLPLGSNGRLAAIDVAIGELSPSTPEPTTTPQPTPRATTDPNPSPPGIPNWGYPTRVPSTFYAGYGATRPGSSVTYVVGSWVQPRGTCTGTSTSAFAAWVGIDDNGVGNLEQLGTEILCARGSTHPIYGAWYEMFPEAAHRIPIRANPGDRFTASVTNRGTKWDLAITNRTSGQHWSITRTRSAKALQALWIAEAPSSQVTEAGQHVLPLTDFGSVRISAARAVVGGVRRSIGNAGWAHYRFDMVTSGGVAKTLTSALSNGTTFTVRWRHR